MNETLYSETSITVYTKDALVKKIKEEPSFIDFCTDFLLSHYSRTEIFENLKEDFLDKVIEETVEDIIWHEYYEVEKEE